MHRLLATLFRLLLIAGLVFSPLAQPFALASLATPQQDTPPAASGACPYHAATADAGHPSREAPGRCCFKKGSACHCAMSVALPSMALPRPPEATTSHPLSAPLLSASNLPPPEPPPPRR